MNAALQAFGSQSNLSLESSSTAVPAELQGRRRLSNSYYIERTRITPDPEQPRKDFDEQHILELMASIQARGIKQPLTVRWHIESSTYRIIDGGRRYLAAERLGLTELPCWIQEGDSKEILVDQIVHNWQRADLKPEETADALARLRDEFNLTQKSISDMTGKPQSEISKFLAIHDWVAPEVQQLARDQAETDSPLTMRHLYNISKAGDAATQKALADRVVTERLTATQVEAIVTKPRSPEVTTIGGQTLRQMRFKTSLADVVFTFHRVNPTNADLLKALDEIRDGLIRMS